jgi:hypothetical protein
MQPGPELAIPGRSGGIERRAMAPDRIADRGPIREGDHSRNVLGLPSPLAGQEHRNEPHLPIEGGVQLLRVHEVALDLRDDKPALAWVPSDDVHRTAFAEVVEGVLDEALVAEAPKPRKDDLHQAGVGFVE